MNTESIINEFTNILKILDGSSTNIEDIQRAEKFIKNEINQIKNSNIKLSSKLKNYQDTIEIALLPEITPYYKNEFIKFCNLVANATVEQDFDLIIDSIDNFNNVITNMRYFEKIAYHIILYTLQQYIIKDENFLKINNQFTQKINIIIQKMTE